jgi:hypothetical protein
VVPKVGCTPSLGVVGLPGGGAEREEGGRGALEVGLFERDVRVFEIQVKQTLGDWYHFIKPIHRIKNLLTVK